MKQIVNTRQAAILFGVTTATMRRYARDKKVPAFKKNGGWRFDLGQLGRVWTERGHRRRPSRNIRADSQRFEDLVWEISAGAVESVEAVQEELLDLALSILAAADIPPNRGSRSRVLKLIEKTRGNPLFEVLGFAHQFWKALEKPIAAG